MSADIDTIPLMFGKHRGKTPEDVSKIDPDYLIWAYEKIKDRVVCSKELYELCCLDIMERDSPLSALDYSTVFDIGL